jgi:transposase-like protein
MAYLWRAVDDEGTVLDVVVQRKRNTKAAMRLLRNLLRNQGIKPTKIVTDKLGSYGAALKLLGLKHLQDVGGRKNNRAESSHVPIRRRELKSQRFRSVRNALKLLSARGQIYNLFNYRRHLISRNSLRKFRSQSNAEWDSVTAPIYV